MWLGPVIDWPLYLIAFGLLAAWPVVVGGGMHLLGLSRRAKVVLWAMVLTAIACFVGAVLAL